MLNSTPARIIIMALGLGSRELQAIRSTARRDISSRSSLITKGGSTATSTTPSITSNSALHHPIRATRTYLKVACPFLLAHRQLPSPRLYQHRFHWAFSLSRSRSRSRLNRLSSTSRLSRGPAFPRQIDHLHHRTSPLPLGARAISISSSSSNTLSSSTSETPRPKVLGEGKVLRRVEARSTTTIPATTMRTRRRLRHAARGRALLLAQTVMVTRSGAIELGVAAVPRWA